MVCISINTNVMGRLRIVLIYYASFAILIDLTQSRPNTRNIGEMTDREIRKLKQLLDHTILETYDGSNFKWDLDRGMFLPSRPVVDLPKNNVRQVLILSLLQLSPEARAKKTSELKSYILAKEAIFEDKKQLQEQELKLLDMGVVVECQWAIRLPPPFDDTQCHLSELINLVNQICVDVVFAGLPICPGTLQEIPVQLSGSTKQK